MTNEKRVDVVEDMDLYLAIFMESNCNSDVP
jgi:hypothetical protein